MNNKKNSIKTLVVSITAGVLCFFVVKLFVIDVVKVNSLSMLPNLKTGKMAWVRPTGFLFNSIKQNDIVLIEQNDTNYQQGKFLKRVIAISGDTILVDSSVVYVNGKRLSINDSLLHNYVIKFKHQSDTMLFAKMNFDEKYLIDDSCVYMVTLNHNIADSLRRSGITINEQIEGAGLYDETIYTHHPRIKWNKDFFGPVYIPKEGDTLRFDTISVYLYKGVIQNEENELEIKEGKVYINQKENSYYVAKENYYFVIGDNLDNSIDSRQWGFIPRKKIKAVLLK